MLLLLWRKTANIHHKSLRRKISTTRVRWPKTFPPSCFLLKSFSPKLFTKTDHIHNDKVRGQISRSVVLIEGTKKAIFLFPPSSAEDCLSKTDIGKLHCCCHLPKNYLIGFPSNASSIVGHNYFLNRWEDFLSSIKQASHQTPPQ